MGQQPKTNTDVEDLNAFKLLPGKINKHTNCVKNWKSNTKSQWAPNWSNHSNCIIYKVFFVEYFFRCGRKVNGYLYVSYWQRYEWLKVLHNTVKIWIFFFNLEVFIKIVSKLSQNFSPEVNKDWFGNWWEKYQTLSEYKKLWFQCKKSKNLILEY